MTQIHPQLIIFFVLLQQRIRECPVFRCRALMVCMLQMKLRVPWRIRPKHLLPSRQHSPKEAVYSSHEDLEKVPFFCKLNLHGFCTRKNTVGKVIICTGTVDLCGNGINSVVVVFVQLICDS